MNTITKNCEACGTPTTDKDDPDFNEKWLCYWCHCIAEKKDPKVEFNKMATAIKVGHLVEEKPRHKKPTEDMYARDVVARAFGWRDWRAVEEDSQRDGYTEAGGRGKLAAAIGKQAHEAQHLIEHVERFGPEELVVYEMPKLDARRIPGDHY